MKCNLEMGKTAIQPLPAQTADSSISGLRFISPLCTSSSCLIPHIYGVNIHSKYLYKYEVKYKVLLRAVSAGNTIFHCIFTQPRAHLLQSPVQDTLKFSPAQEHICLIISLRRPTFCPCYLTDMKRVDVKQSKEGLTYKLTWMLYHRHLQHPINILPTQHPPHTLSTVHMF